MVTLENVFIRDITSSLRFYLFLKRGIGKHSPSDLIISYDHSICLTIPSRMSRRRLYNETGPSERLWFAWLWAAGLSFRCIARRARRSPTTVRRWVKCLLEEEHKATSEGRLRTCKPPLTYEAQYEAANLHMRSLHWIYLDKLWYYDPWLAYRVSGSALST